MFYIRFVNVLCYYIILIDSKYIISPLKAFVHRVATIHKRYMEVHCCDCLGRAISYEPEVAQFKNQKQKSPDWRMA